MPLKRNMPFSDKCQTNGLEFERLALYVDFVTFDAFGRSLFHAGKILETA